MKEIIVRTVVVAVVSIVIGGMTKSVAERRKNIEENGLNPLESGQYAIKYDWRLQILMIICCILLTSGFIMVLGNLCWGWFPSGESSLVATCGMGAFAALAFATVLGTCVWRIDVNGEVIIYRNYFGIKKKYNFKELEVRVSPKYTIRAYKNNKKVFTIDNNLPAGMDFLYWAQQYGVRKNEK